MPVIVQVDGDFFAFNQELSRRSGRENPNALSLVHAYSARLEAHQIQWLLESPLVEYVTLDAVIRSTADTAADPTEVTLNSRVVDRRSPLAHKNEENVFLAAIGADQAQQAGYTGKDVTVAVLDSGFNPHRDLSEKRILETVDFTSGEPVFLNRKKNHDDYGHGTPVSGIIGGTGRESHGMHRGVAPKVEFVQVKGWNRPDQQSDQSH